jgi:hypothetical protein
VALDLGEPVAVLPRPRGGVDDPLLAGARVVEGHRQLAPAHREPAVERDRLLTPVRVL